MPVVSNDFSDIVYNRRSIRNFDTICQDSTRRNVGNLR